MKPIIYISGSIQKDIDAGRDYVAKFKEAENQLREIFLDDAIILNPAEMLPKGLPYEMYMEAYLAMIPWCDYLFMLVDYKESSGAMREYDRGEMCGKKFIFQSGLISLHCLTDPRLFYQ